MWSEAKDAERVAAQLCAELDNPDRPGKAARLLQTPLGTVTVYTLDHRRLTKLEQAAKALGPSVRQENALWKLGKFTATRRDVEELLPLAEMAGVSLADVLK